MANKYSKIKPKIHPIAYIIGALLLLVVILSAVFFSPTPKQKFHSKYVKAQSKVEGITQEQILSKDHVFANASVSKILKEVDKQELVIVFHGGLWCNNCLKYAEAFNGEFKKNETLTNQVKKILYLAEPEGAMHPKNYEQMVEKYGVEQTPQVPLLLAFYKGQLVKTFKAHEAVTEFKDMKTNVKNFYDDVLETIKTI